MNTPPSPTKHHISFYSGCTKYRYHHLEDHTANPLIGAAQIGRYNRTSKRINKISLGQMIVSIGHR